MPCDEFEGDYQMSEDDYVQPKQWISHLSEDEYDQEEELSEEPAEIIEEILEIDRDDSYEGFSNSKENNEALFTVLRTEERPIYEQAIIEDSAEMLTNSI